MKYKNIFPILFVFLAMPMAEFGVTAEQEIYKDFESFKNTLHIGILEKRVLDINNDGMDDILVYTSGGEETFLTLLIRTGGRYVAAKVPVGLEYEILGQKGE